MSKQNKIIGIAVILTLIVAGVVYGISSNLKHNEPVKTTQEDKNQDVILSLSYDKEISEGSQEEIVIPVKLSYLPSGVFPSASMSVEFDKDKLEFIGVKKGTMQDSSKTVPEWTFDVDASNKSGVVNAIYLDKSGAKNSYYKSGFEKGKKDVVLNLVFKLKGEAKSGDMLNLNIADAVFATVNGDTDNSNLSTAKNTMKNKNLILEVR